MAKRIHPATAVTTAVALCLLFCPLPWRPTGGWSEAVGEGMHVVIWAGLAWVWRRAWQRYPVRGAFLLLCAPGLVEVAQTFLGRDAEWLDWAFGAAGGLCVLPAVFRRQGGWLALPVLLALAPMGWQACLWGAEMAVYPRLIPGAPWDTFGWVADGVEVESVQGGGIQIRAAGGTPSYPGVFRRPARADWREATSIRMRLFWPDADGAIFAVRVDDRENPAAYADRFQREFTVQTGWNELEFSREEFRQTSGGRAMELEHVKQWGVFLVSAPDFHYFGVSDVMLTLDTIKERSP